MKTNFVANETVQFRVFSQQWYLKKTRFTLEHIDKMTRAVLIEEWINI